MDPAPAEAKPHSAEFFNEMRDHWWHADFLELMAKRLALGEVRRVLDVGCGVGHWSRSLAPVLSPEATVVGVDREPCWVKEAGEAAARLGLHPRFTYRQGDALALPFDDGVFDFVTCQTVLMHLPDAVAGLREMLRVVKPGGLVLAAEPSNMAQVAVFSSVTDTFPTAVVADMLRFHLTLQRGKRASGQGFSSVGDLLPGLFASLGFADIRVCMNDRASPMFPPYTRPAQRAEREQVRDWHRRGHWVWQRDETLRHFLAGGGDEAEFERLWQQAGRQMELELAAMDAGTYHCGGAGATYLVSGRKP